MCWLISRHPAIMMINSFIQMNSILSFKNLENIDPDDVSVGDDLIQQMKDFHEELMKKISIVTADEEGAEDVRD